MIERPIYERRILQGIERSPICALLGPRQCGKTTLARKVGPGGRAPAPPEKRFIINFRPVPNDLSRWFVACLLLVTGIASAHATAAERPNILFAFADDWSLPHAGAYGDAMVRTPTIDRLAERGVQFEHAYISSPSCTPARSSVLTGQDFWRLGKAANLWSRFPENVSVYPDLLAEEAGYFIGKTVKGWGPGNIGDRDHNPAGPAYGHFPDGGVEGFEQFLEAWSGEQPFCFWFGSFDPHRPYDPALRRTKGIDPDDVHVPPVMPDAPAVRADIADYYAEVERFDRELGEMLQMLEERGELENTLVVVSSDNGWPFPRGKGNLYDLGVRMPLVIAWPRQIPPGRKVSDFVNLTDLAPTFLEVGGVDVPNHMTGRSLLDLLRNDASGRIEADRNHVVVGRERHTPAQEAPKAGGYPMRAIRTDDYLYIRNFKPDRWPAGTPHWQQAHMEDAWLGDCDNGPAKYYIWAHREDDVVAPLYDLAFGKRPAEEIYDVHADPYQVDNLADDPDYALVREQLAERLMQKLRNAEDPRALGIGDDMDVVEYLGGIPQWPGEEVIDEYR